MVEYKLANIMNIILDSRSKKRINDYYPENQFHFFADSKLENINAKKKLMYIE